MKKPLLFLPGPMQVPDHILAAASRPMFNHRSSEMDAFLSKLENGCRRLCGTAGDVIFLASSGTGAMESAIVNLTSPGEEIIVIVGGTFAQRWTEIGKAYGLTPHTVNVDWRKGPEVSEVEAALRQFPAARTVFMTWSESSTGVLNELEAIGRLIRSQGKYLVVDAVSGLAVSPMKMDDWCVDAVISGSQKGLMLPAGIGLVAVGSRAWELEKQAKSPRFYWEWSRYKGTAPFTPALTLLFQLDAALDYIAELGHERFFGRRAEVASHVRGLVETAGFELYAVKPGDGVTAVLAPAPFDIPAFKNSLEKDYGIQIAGGLGPLATTIFRIGHVGHVSSDELEYFTNSFKAVLSNS